MSTTLDEVMTLVATLESEAVYAAAGGGRDGLEGVRTARKELRTRLASLVADAERYQFIREVRDAKMITDAQFDAQLDAARGIQQTGEQQ